MNYTDDMMTPKERRQLQGLMAKYAYGDVLEVMADIAYEDSRMSDQTRSQLLSDAAHTMRTWEKERAREEAEVRAASDRNIARYRAERERAESGQGESK